jgi:hypothetical protein
MDSTEPRRETANQFAKEACGEGTLGHGVACEALATWALPVAAQQQFVLIDATYTATAANTKDSQFLISPLAAAPANWRAPVDYASGSIYVRFEVLEKPSTADTYYGICFEAGTSSITCMPYPPLYNKPGVYTVSPKISLFWQYDMFDWTMPVQKVAVVLKDSTMRAAQGDAMFYPTKVHVTVTVVPPGKTYVDPNADDDAGIPPASTPSKPMTNPVNAFDAGTSNIPVPTKPGATPASTAGQAGKALLGSAGSTISAGRGAGTSGAESPDAGTHRSISSYVDSGEQCGVAGRRGSGALSGWLFASLIVLGRAASARRNAKRKQA